MTERRSSLKGRGAEILLGSPQAVGTARREPPVLEPEPAIEGEPLSMPPPDGEPGAGLAAMPLPDEGTALADASPELTAAGPEAAAEPDVPEPDVLEPGGDGGQEAGGPSGVEAEAEEPQPLADDTFGPAFYEEALAAESAPGEEEQWASEMEWPPTPEQELAFFEEARLAEDAPPALASAPAPAQGEATMVQADLLGTVLPPRPGSAVPDEQESKLMSTTDDIQSPDQVVPPYELPERPLTEDQRKALAEAEDPRMRELDAEVTQAYQEVVDQVGENESIANECFNQLIKARDIILRRDVARLAQAEYYIEQARARLRRAAVSKKGARRHAWWITIWGFIWAVVYVGALVMLDSVWVTDFIGQLQLNSRFIDPGIFLPAMVWGGLGGVVAIWYSLFKHVSARDFDSYYNISYIGKPFFGLILGATVYMVVQLVIVSLGIWPAPLPQGIEGVITPSLAPWIIYLLAWASGFKENRIFGVVDLVMKRIFSSEESSTAQGSPIG